MKTIKKVRKPHSVLFRLVSTVIFLFLLAENIASAQTNEDTNPFTDFISSIASFFSGDNNSPTIQTQAGESGINFSTESREPGGNPPPPPPPDSTN